MSGYSSDIRTVYGTVCSGSLDHVNDQVASKMASSSLSADFNVAAHHLFVLMTLVCTCHREASDLA